MSKKSLTIAPISTASWLIDNTSLTFKQIADFCNSHEMDIQSIADGFRGKDVLPCSPVKNGNLTLTEIRRCENDAKASLKNCFEAVNVGVANKKTKAKKYITLSQRRNKPEVILWLITYFPELSERQIVKLTSSTKNMIAAIKEKTHRHYSVLVPKDPVIAGFCSQRQLNEEIEIAKSKINN